MIKRLNRLKQQILGEIHSPMLTGFLRVGRTQCGTRTCRCARIATYRHKQRQYGRYEGDKLRFKSITKDQEHMIRDSIRRYRRLKLAIGDLATAWLPLLLDKQRRRKNPTSADLTARSEALEQIKEALSGLSGGSNNPSAKDAP